MSEFTVGDKISLWKMGKLPKNSVVESLQANYFILNKTSAYLASKKIWIKSRVIKIKDLQNAGTIKFIGKRPKVKTIFSKGDTIGKDKVKDLPIGTILIRTDLFSDIFNFVLEEGRVAYCDVEYGSEGIMSKKI